MSDLTELTGRIAVAILEVDDGRRHFEPTGTDYVEDACEVLGVDLTEDARDLIAEAFDTVLSDEEDELPVEAMAAWLIDRVTACRDRVRPRLGQTSPELIEALRTATGRRVGVFDSGGGCAVARIELGGGFEVWLTREADWVIGFYAFGLDDGDPGTCVELTMPGADPDDPTQVAEAVAKILSVAGMVKR